MTTAATPDRAIAAAAAVASSGTLDWNQRCKEFCRTMYQVASDGARTAREAWGRTKHRGTGPPPRGALVWWTSGSAGHVVIADGHGNAIGNYYPDHGRVRLLHLSAWSQMMGGPPVGWSRDIDGVLVVPEPDRPPPRPDARVHKVVPGDTLSALAAHYGTTVADLVALNGLRDPDRITVGQVLRLPVKG